MVEGDPAAGIVDAETFTLHVVGFVASIVELYSPEDRLRIEIKKIDKAFDLPSRSLSFSCSWDAVPESTQRLLAMQYDAVSLDEEKEVSVEFSQFPSAIKFRLGSSHIGNYVDYYGENHVGDGLTLKLRNRQTAGIEATWQILKIPSVAFQRGLSEFWESDELELNPSRPYIHTEPAGLSELQDLARFFEANKERAVLA